jgi:hydrogenase maturation protease
LEEKKILILGLGNVLMGDEGIGVKAIEYLKDKPLPSNVELLDGGTGGFHLLSLFEEYPVMIMIDATISTNLAGEVKHIRPKFASDFPKSLTSHDIGLRDLMQSAQLIGELPDMHLITISIFDFRQVHMNLTPEAEQSLPKIYDMVLEILQELEAV